MIKIMVDTQEEYDQVMHTCRYIHDYTVDINGMSKKTKVEVTRIWGNDKADRQSMRMKPEKGSRWLGFSLDHDLEEYKFLNILAHGIADCHDPKVRDKYLILKGK